jgi:hypothetical protein
MKKEVGELRDETTRLRGELERAESRLQIVSRDRKELASRLAMIKSATPPASAQRPLFPVEVNQTNINADPIYRKADDIARTIFNMSLAEILS